MKYFEDFFDFEKGSEKYKVNKNIATIGGEVFDLLQELKEQAESQVEDSPRYTIDQQLKAAAIVSYNKRTELMMLIEREKDM